MQRSYLADVLHRAQARIRCPYRRVFEKSCSRPHSWCVWRAGNHDKDAALYIAAVGEAERRDFILRDPVCQWVLTAEGEDFLKLLEVDYSDEE